MALEVVADFSRYRARRYVVSAAERRQQVVRRVLIRDVGHREPGAPLVTVGPDGSVTVPVTFVELPSWACASGPAARKHNMTGTSPSKRRTNLIILFPHECGRGALLRCGQK